MGFNLRLTKDYLNILYLNITKNFRNNNLDNLYLEIDQTSIMGLELQRRIKHETGGPIPDDMKIWYPATINYNGKKIDIKIKLKGNRFIHWYHPKKTSYKIDVRGDNFIFDMEEFSIQKPITKNYSYEFLFHKLLGYVDLINIKYEFINLYFNDQQYGVFAIEESFSNNILLRHGKPEGPIFSIKDELGEKFPNIFFELYSKNYWKNKDPLLVNDLFVVLNNIKLKEKHVNDHFDIDKWAKYFSIMDLAGTYHGSLLDSVKLYYNKDSKLFEPIGYDLHKGAGIFDNFIISDFLDERIRAQCSWICDHKELFELFLKDNSGNLNKVFLEKYTSYLKEYSDSEFLNKFLEKYKIELKKYNSAIYSDYSKSDKIGWIGAGFFVYDQEYLINRANLIKDRINSIDLNKIKISKINDHIIYEDFLSSRFPVRGTFYNCDNENSYEYFFSGSMKIDFSQNCKNIKFIDYDKNFKDIKVENNPEINF